jgi:hypothetical protein
VPNYHQHIASILQVVRKTISFVGIAVIVQLLSRHGHAVQVGLEIVEDLCHQILVRRISLIADDTDIVLPRPKDSIDDASDYHTGN